MFVRKMEHFAFFFCVLLNFSGFNNGNIANYYSIYRNYSVFGDSFVIPKHLCRNTGTTCQDYEALNDGNLSCKCKCPEDKGTFLSPSGNKWKCVDDRSLRHKAKCAITLLSEKDSQISTLSVGGGSLNYIIGLDAKPGQKCDVDFVACKYQFCNGSWVSLKHKTQVSSNIFKVHHSGGGNFLRVKLSSRTPPQDFYGRIIKLAFTPGCRVRGKGDKPCLLIKLQGHVDCPNTVHYRSVSPSYSVTSNVSPTPTASLHIKSITVSSSTAHRNVAMVTSSLVENNSRMTITHQFLTTKTIKTTLSSPSPSFSYKEIRPSTTSTVIESSQIKDNSGSGAKMEDASKVLPIIITSATAGGILILVGFFLVAKCRRSM